MLKEMIEEIERQHLRMQGQVEETMNQMEEFQQSLPLVFDASFEKIKQRQKDNMLEFQKILTSLINKVKH